MRQKGINFLLSSIHFQLRVSLTNDYYTIQILGLTHPYPSVIVWFVT
jgi:hypothetical protein